MKLWTKVWHLLFDSQCRYVCWWWKC